MIYIYKLKYINRETAITDLIAKGVIDINENNTSITQAVVDLGLIVLEYEPTPIFADGYHFDIMVTTEIDFGTARVTPNNVKHAFLGFNTNDYNIINTNTNINETTIY